MRLLPRLFLAILAVASSLGCSESITFETPGRAPPAADDFVIEVDGTPRGFGPGSLAKNGSGQPTIFAQLETKSAARITLPAKPSTTSCAEIPKAIVLTTSSPLEHANTTYNEATWSATECTITVSRIDATGTQGAEGSFTGTLVRDMNEVGGKEIDGPQTLTVKGTFVVRAK